MRFTELETIMISRDISTLAEIARKLNTTPQAVSNWKARDQVPHHIVSKINALPSDDDLSFDQSSSGGAFSSGSLISNNTLPEETIALSDILLVMAEQLKVILIITFVSIFSTFTYVKFIEKPQYESWTKIVLPESKSGTYGQLSGLASQFGVNFPSASGADLSSPSLFPELLRSRIFSEKILAKNFYTDNHRKQLSLLAILTGKNSSDIGSDTLITSAIPLLNNMIDFDQDVTGNFSIIKVTASEPIFAKKLAEAVVFELEALNRFFKTQSVNEKILFINKRINSVIDDLQESEKRLKEFNEQNRQISSPSLQLDLDRLTRDVEVQKEIYLTLKQQLELAKIEEVQEASILQVLDKPQVPIGPSNKNVKAATLLAGFLGLVFGIIIGFARSYLNNSNIDERRKLRRMRNFIKKKSKDIILDKRVSAIFTVLLIIGLPFYLGHQSKDPVFFGLYSTKLMIFNLVYIISLISSIILFFRLSKKEHNI